MQQLSQLLGGSLLFRAICTVYAGVQRLLVLYWQLGVCSLHPPGAELPSVLGDIMWQSEPARHLRRRKPGAMEHGSRPSQPASSLQPALA
mmetsp:Transcript_54686/g.118228  ORF Transcript_54686/g.118228 Transcript_54686/m.118228 type:complete len:90 (+) Transcript_54686:136-405(+)